MRPRYVASPNVKHDPLVSRQSPRQNSTVFRPNTGKDVSFFAATSVRVVSTPPCVTSCLPNHESHEIIAQILDICTDMCVCNRLNRA